MIDALEAVDSLHSVGAEDRRRATSELAARLGSGWKPEEPNLAEDALSLFHEPTGLRFVAIPGGRFDMGLSDADMEEAAEHVDWTAPIAALFDGFAQHARPVHPVQVRPFLASRTLLLDVALIRRLSGGRVEHDSMSREQAREVTRAAGLRLPSEAELEWIARDGGIRHFTLGVATRNEPMSRFGLEHVMWGEWAEDDWHPTYDGAPSISTPWYDGVAHGVYRHAGGPEMMQSRDELIFMLAGVRGEGRLLPGFTGARLARDLA